MALSIDFQDSVSFPPGYPSYRTLTLVLVGLTPTEYTSLRWTYADSSSCLYSSGCSSCRLTGVIASFPASSCTPRFGVRTRQALDSFRLDREPTSSFRLLR